MVRHQLTRRAPARAPEAPRQAMPTPQAATATPVQAAPAVQPVGSPSVPDEAAIAAKVRREMQAEYEKALASAHAEAEKQGYAAGLSKAEESVKRASLQQAQQFAALAGSLNKLRSSFVVEAEDSIVEIAYAAICRVLGDGMTSSEGIRAIARQAIAEAGDSQDLTLRLHPSDHALVGGTADSAESAPFMSNVKLVSDPSIRAGGCIVDSRHGSLDARLDVQLERLRHTLLEARRVAQVAAGKS